MRLAGAYPEMIFGGGHATPFAYLQAENVFVAYLPGGALRAPGSVGSTDITAYQSFLDVPRAKGGIATMSI